MLWRRSSSLMQWLPRLQSHRGYWVNGLQQNSLSSIKEAFRLGYKIAEFDVRLTADNVAVLFHDEGYNSNLIFKTDYIKFKSLIANDFPELSKLEDVFQWMNFQIKKDNQFDFKLNIEIKSKRIFDSRLENEIFELIEKYELADFILISSFNPFSLFKVRLRLPLIHRALLVTHSEESNFLLNSMILNIFAKPDLLHLRWNDFDESIESLVKKNIPVVLWTVNDLVDIKKYEGLISGVISDRITPEEFKKVSVK